MTSCLDYGKVTNWVFYVQNKYIWKKLTVCIESLFCWNIKVPMKCLKYTFLVIHVRLLFVYSINSFNTWFIINKTKLYSLFGTDTFWHERYKFQDWQWEKGCFEDEIYT